jgi:hypothetical protein
MAASTARDVATTQRQKYELVMDNNRQVWTQEVKDVVDKGIDVMLLVSLVIVLICSCGSAYRTRWSQDARSPRTLTFRLLRRVFAQRR